MRIAVVNNFFPPRPGGSSHLADHLARQYAAKGHEVLVLTAAYQGAPATEIVDGVRILRVHAWTLPKSRFASNFDIGFTMSPSVLRRVFGILDDFDPDVVHQHGQFFDLTWLSGIWARRRRVPALLSIHTRLESPLSRFNNFAYGLADRVLVTPLMKVHRPDLVVMDSLMDDYVDRRYHRSRGTKVAIPVGIDAKHLAAGNRTRMRTELGLGDRPMIVSVGHVIPQRSRIALVKALPAVLRALPDTVLVVVGGVYHDEFLSVAEDLGVRDHIMALGAQPQSDIADYLAAADVEVHELEGMGFGTASLEALAVGTPVVAAVRPDNFLGIQLKDRYHLYLAPFLRSGPEHADPEQLAEVLIEVLADPVGARSSVADNARDLIREHFTIESVAQAHLEHLQGMVSRPSPDARGVARNGSAGR